MSTRSSVLFVVATLALVGCGGGGDAGDSGPGPDGAVTDSSVADGAAPDGGADAARDSSAPDTGVPDGSLPPPSSGCAALAAALPARSGATIRVSPAGGGNVTVDGETRTLRQVVSSAASGDTILLEDGTYGFDEASGGGYTGLYFTTPNVTLRSASGDATAVVLDSSYADHGDQTAPVTIAANGVVVADLTVRASIFHLVHLWDDADGSILHNLRLIDGGQQFVKGSPGDGMLDDVQVSCSEFRMTTNGRDNVWGYGAADGSTACYTGGIDAHSSRNWRVLHNSFDGIYCDATGVQRPAHGKKGSARGDMTYNGGLSEHGVHMWDSPAGSAHLIEGNLIRNCARGIGVGLRDEVYGTIIRNNMIWSEHAGSREHDVGIIIERGHDIVIENNTLYFSAADSYPSTIEYRWDSSAGMIIRNNLTNRAIRSRNGADASLSQNITDAAASLFVDAAGGDLHLASCDAATVVGAGDVLPTVTTDYDGDPREGSNDIGADQCTP